MNNCTFIGRLTKDPVIRYTKDNQAVCSFTIAVNRYKGMADFFRVEAWGETARNCEKYLAKGRQVGVVGDMRNNSYEKDGVKHLYDVLHADRVEFLEWGEKKEAPTAEAEQARQMGQMMQGNFANGTYDQANANPQEVMNQVQGMGINAHWENLNDDIPF